MLIVLPSVLCHFMMGLSAFVPVLSTAVVCTDCGIALVLLKPSWMDGLYLFSNCHVIVNDGTGEHEWWHTEPLRFFLV